MDNGNQTSKLEILPLNALDNSQFDEVVSHFPKGEITIVNEGLLMYLDNAEKEKLCRNIHKVLTDRGGYWITADIYIKQRTGAANVLRDDRQKNFLNNTTLKKTNLKALSLPRHFSTAWGLRVIKRLKLIFLS